MATRRTRTIVARCRYPAEPEITWSVFLQRLWREGAGMLPPPRIDASGDEHGIGCRRWIAIGPTRGVRERIVDGAHPDWFEYRVENPSWSTYPVETHRGLVRFEGVEGGATRIAWRVEVVPKPGAWPLVWAFTRMTIWWYLRALRRASRSASR